MARRLSAAAVAALTSLAAAGCGGSGHPAQSAHLGVSKRADAVGLHGQPVQVVQPGVPKGEQTVKLLVISAPDRETTAFVPVFLNGKGPFPFAVDTGASGSVIDTALARKLGLASQGSMGVIHGVTGSAKSTAVAIHLWRAGSVALPPVRLATANMGRHAPVGLLGSDVMSRYGKVAIDYSHDLLLLDPPVK